MVEKRFFTLAKIAERRCCSHSTVLTHVRNGALRAVDISTNPKGRSHYLVPAESLEEFEESRVTAPPQRSAARKSPSKAVGGCHRVLYVMRRKSRLGLHGCDPDRHGVLIWTGISVTRRRVHIGPPHRPSFAGASCAAAPIPSSLCRLVCTSCQEQLRQIAEETGGVTECRRAGR